MGDRPQFGKGGKERGEVVIARVVQGEVAPCEDDFAIASRQIRFHTHRNLIKWNAHRRAAKVWDDAKRTFSTASILYL